MTSQLSFEAICTDLVGRIGRLYTKSGAIETPAVLPVVHPVRQSIPPSLLRQMGFEAVMTNAYITLRRLGSEAVQQGIHRVIGFDGVVMTDSGGYQVLEYGDVQAAPAEVARYQEDIGSDIAVVLDTPTGIGASRRRAVQTVETTINAAKRTIDARHRPDLLWVGPIQGGRYLDLVQSCATALAKLGFDLYALGSPVELMERYDFRVLVSMIVAARSYLPLEAPLHLFGAGHPLILPLAVALGCDLFDSASYILYARDDRYMTELGTQRLRELSYFQCSCTVCTTRDPDELRAASKGERIELLAQHNLYVLVKEVRAVKQCIREGRLWEYLGARARSHPKLWQAFRALGKYVKLLEEGTPLFKERAAFFFDAIDQIRPEAETYNKRLLRTVAQARKKDLLLIVPESEAKPFAQSQVYTVLVKQLGETLRGVQVCFLTYAYGLVPVELSELYPLSQYVSCLHDDVSEEIEAKFVERAATYVKKARFGKVIVIEGEGSYARTAQRLQELLRFVRLAKVDVRRPSRDEIDRLVSTITAGWR